MNITTCTHCGNAYEESSEERANERDRLCGTCFERRCLNRAYNGTANPFETSVAERTAPTPGYVTMPRRGSQPYPRGPQ